MGSSSKDNDDVIYMLIDFWEKHHGRVDLWFWPSYFARVQGSWYDRGEK
jgi:hypothetical protein